MIITKLISLIENNEFDIKLMEKTEQEQIQQNLMEEKEPKRKR